MTDFNRRTFLGTAAASAAFTARVFAARQDSHSRLRSAATNHGDRC